MKNRILPRGLKPLVLAAAIAAVALVTAPSTASAQVTFTLNSIALETGTTASGTLSGTFTLNNALTQLLSFDIIASPGASTGGHSYPGFTYLSTNTGLTVTNGLTQATPNFEIQDNLGDKLELNFTSLTTTQAVLAPSLGSTAPASFESELAGGNRAVVSGIAATPEPSAWALGLLAALGLGVLRTTPRKRLRVRA